MKKKFLTIIIIIITISSINSLKAQEYKDKFSWEISSDLNTSFQSFSSDIKFDISDKLYLSNWSSYSSKGKQEFELPYMISSSAINYKATKKLLLSAGYRNFNNIENSEKTNYLNLKVTLKLF